MNQQRSFDSQSVEYDLGRIRKTLARIEQLLCGQAEGFANSMERIGLDMRHWNVLERLAWLRLLALGKCIAPIAVVDMSGDMGENFRSIQYPFLQRTNSLGGALKMVVHRMAASPCK
ncbi:MAG: hypothetical protein ACLPXB_03525 [Thiobacillaceae bacterium]